MCSEYGYYEMSKGYRKVPGNICHGGLSLAPIRYQCNFSGYSIFSIKGLFMIFVFGAIMYYGWPLIEAFLAILPTPSPKIIKVTIIKWYKGLKSRFDDFKVLMSQSTESQPRSTSGY